MPFLCWQFFKARVTCFLTEVKPVEYNSFMIDRSSSYWNYKTK